MAKAKSTKRALLAAVLALVVSISMLVGTTFAWFTDSVTSGRNTIQSGNLDIVLQYSVDNGATWAEVTKDTNVFGYDNWEPGFTKVIQFKVTNNGSLDLKYKLSADVYSETAGINKAGDKFLLSDYLYTKMVDVNATREDILAMKDGVNFANSYMMSAKSLADGETDHVAIAIWMPTSVGNIANHNGTAPVIEFGINLVATQEMAEEDSFGNDYDEDASFPGEAKTVKELVDALKAGQNVKLGGDIDLAGVAWEPIATYSGILDGNGFAIKNMTINATSEIGVGMFESISGATIRNLKLENVNVNTTSYRAGAVAGQIAKEPTAPQTVIENVTVSGTVNGGGYYTGGLIGADSGFDTVVRNCENNADVTAPGQQVGGILGYAKRGTVVDSCVNNGDITGGIFVGGILGLAAGDDENPDLSVVVKNCKNTGNIAETDVTNSWAGGVADIVGFAGREGGKTPSAMTTFYFIDNTVREGQKVYGRIGNVSGGTDYITVYAGDSIPAGDAIAIQNAVAALGANEDATFFLTDGNYDGDVNLTVAAIGDKTGDIAFVAVPGTKPVLTGLTTLGFYERRNNDSKKFNANITFEGITFDQTLRETHSLDIQNVKSINLIKCTIIGDGEYGIVSPGSNPIGPSKITDCTFINAGAQIYGNFGTDLVVSGCTFDESVLNIGGGDSVTVKDCTFTKTLTDINNGDSYYVIRTSSTGTPIKVENCKIAVDSTVNGIAEPAANKAFAVLHNRHSTKAWEISNVQITLTDAALAQPNLNVILTAGGAMNTSNVTVNGVAQ